MGIQTAGRRGPARKLDRAARVSEEVDMATTIACPHCNKPLTASVTLDRAPRAPAARPALTAKG